VRHTRFLDARDRRRWSEGALRRAESTGSPDRIRHLRRGGRDASARAGIFRVGGPAAKPKPESIGRSLASRSGTSPTLTAVKEIKAGYTPRFEFRGRLTPGHYVYGIRLVSAMNGSRSQTFVSNVFRVG
jgi:hypothetical protein